MGSKDREEIRGVLRFLIWIPGYTGEPLGNKRGGISLGRRNEEYRFIKFNLN